MPHPHTNVVKGPDDALYTPSGEKLTLPDHWEFLPAGDAALTRKVKSKGPAWVVQEKYRNRMISKGIWADAAHIKDATKEVAASRSTPAYARQKELRIERQRKKETAYAKEFRDEIIQFLNFHPRYAPMARRMGDLIAAHATPVGSNTVARTRRIPIDQRAKAAVIAWMRHATTPYDAMKIPRIKGRRRQIRQQLAGESIDILNRYRQGRPTEPHCPLHQALEKTQKD